MGCRNLPPTYLAVRVRDLECILEFGRAEILVRYTDLHANNEANADANTPLQRISLLM